jgi:hypothetical protein
MTNTLAYSTKAPMTPIKRVFVKAGTSLLNGMAPPCYDRLFCIKEKYRFSMKTADLKKLEQGDQPY